METGPEARFFIHKQKWKIFKRVMFVLARVFLAKSQNGFLESEDMNQRLRSNY